MKFINIYIHKCIGLVSFLLITTLSLFAAPPAPAPEYYTEPPVFESRPNPAKESKFGAVGVTGLKLRVEPGVVLKVDETTPTTPADGKIMKDDH